MASKAKRIQRYIRYSILYYCAIVLIWLFQRLPRGFLIWLTGALGYLAYYLAAPVRRRSMAHLKIAFRETKSEAELKSICRGMFVYMGKNTVDVARSFRMETGAEVAKAFTIIGKEHLDAAFAKGKGVLVLTGHIGAFDLVGTFTALNYPTMIIGTKLKDPRLDSIINKHRSKNGCEYVYKGENTIRLMKGLRQGKLLDILIDHDTKVKSRMIPFLGTPAATAIGGTMLAMRAKASVVPVFAQLNEKDEQVITCLPEIEFQYTENEEADIIANTTKLNQALEFFILKSPKQWIWHHERWKTSASELIL
jgi:KDO2-lipid IV(A) lauroyltransferase